MVDPEVVARVVKHTGVCQAHHGEHMPAVHGTDVHHIWPSEDGGPTVAENLIEIDAQLHRNVHELLRLYRRHGGPPPWPELRRFGQPDRRLAALGWERIQRRAL